MEVRTPYSCELTVFPIGSGYTQCLDNNEVCFVEETTAFWALKQALYTPVMIPHFGHFLCCGQ